MLNKMRPGLCFRWIAGCFLVWTVLCCSQTAWAMSMEVAGGDVGALMGFAAKNGGINLILDNSVGGKISLSIKDAAPMEIIRYIAKARNLSLVQDGNVVVVGSHDSISRGYGKVHVLPVKHGQLEELREAILLELYQTAGKQSSRNTTSSSKQKKTDAQQRKEESYKGAGSNKAAAIAGPRVGIDVGTRSILFYGTDEEARRAEALLAKLDVPSPQISLEARIMSVSKSAADKLGITWRWSRIPQYNDSSKRSQWSDDGNPGGIISFGKGPEGKPFEMYYSAQLDALVSKGQAKLVSKPNIITMQGREAVINVGAEVPVPTVAVTNSTTTTSIEYKPAGIILRCVPYANADGVINARIHTEVSTPVFVKEMNAYSFQKRAAETMVQLKDGEAMVIGGLISQEEAKSISKVPFLSSIPILGNLFKSREKSTENSEIIIFFTAKIVS